MIKHNIEEQANALADYMPNGKLFEAKKINDSNYRQLLLGIGSELFTAEGYLISLNNEYLPDQTVLFIEEWESALGIPDDCFSTSGSINNRRKNILVKLASLGVQTANDFKGLATIFGVAVDVHAGFDVGSTFPVTFPFVFFDRASDARFTIVVDFFIEESNKFPLTFPFTFGSEEIAILECLFGKLKPANCNVIFRRI